MNSDFLEHHGILGMHWGHRKTKSSSNKNRKKSSKSSKVSKGSKLKSALKSHKKALIAAGVVGGTAALCAMNPVFGKVLGNTIGGIASVTSRSIQDTSENAQEEAIYRSMVLDPNSIYNKALNDPNTAYLRRSRS